MGKVEHITERNKYIINGWVRKQNNFKNLRIPTIIYHLCILYFREEEIFQIISNNGIILSKDRKKITKINQNWNYDYSNTNYGTEINSQTKFIHTWTLKLVNKIKYLDIIIGITTQINPNKIYDKGQNTLCYGFCDDHKFSHNENSYYGKKWMIGDILTINLDLNKKQLYLLINQQNQGIAFENIKSSEKMKYRLFVSLYCIEESVEILQYNKM